MTFPRTIARIEECHKLLGVLITIHNDPVTFRAQVNAAIYGIRSIWDSLGCEGLQGCDRWKFDPWKNEQWEQLQATPFFKLFNASRIDYFHQGDKTVRATAHIGTLELTPDELRPVLQLTPEDLFSQDQRHIQHPGIRIEQAIRSVPQPASNIRISGGTVTICPGATVNMHNVDLCDVGGRSSSVQADPFETCLVALRYMENLVKSAQVEFGNQTP
jgi:hypothetical protein